MSDAADIANIYNHYVRNSVATFETVPLASEQITQRIDKTISADLPWLVAESAGQLLGYAYAARWRDRPAYRFSVETTIYLEPQCTQRGTGFRLYTALIDAIRQSSNHTVIGGIALPNEASVRLHEKLGFRKTGHLEQVGFKFDRWVDVGYWQLTL